MRFALAENKLISDLTTLAGHCCGGIARFPLPDVTANDQQIEISNQGEGLERVRTRYIKLCEPIQGEQLATN